MALGVYTYLLKKNEDELVEKVDKSSQQIKKALFYKAFWHIGSPYGVRTREC